MKTLTLLIGLLLACLGMVVLAVPDIAVNAIHLVHLPPVLYMVAALRIGIGTVFILAAPGSRMPMTLRLLGAFVLVAGLLTPFLGEWGAHLVLEWWSTTGPVLFRLFGAIAIAMGAFVAYAVAPQRR